MGVWITPVLQAFNQPAIRATQDDDDDDDGTVVREPGGGLVRVIYPKHRSDWLKAIIGAALLDAADVDDRILDGSCVLLTDAAKHDLPGCVDAALYTIYGARIGHGHHLTPQTDIGIVLACDGGDRYLKVWQACAAVIGIGPVNDLPDLLTTTRDWKWTLSDVTDPKVFDAVFAAVTGDAQGFDASDLIGLDVNIIHGILKHGVSADTALRRLVAHRDAQREDDTDDVQAIIDDTDPVPLAAAAKDVVVKLSQMTGFGDAKTWGLQLADDIRDYRRGLLSWDDIDKGILASGPSGCGKTTFAKALAAECGVDCVVSTYTDWEAGTGSHGVYVVKALSKLFKDRWLSP